jgi:hypothetical protein
MPRTIILTDQAEAFEQLRSAMETDLTLQAIAKEHIHRERAAQLEATLAMMRCGVKMSHAERQS